MTYTVELVKERKWFVRLVASNGKTVLVTETYYSRFNARRSAKRLAKMFGVEYEEVYE